MADVIRDLEYFGLFILMLGENLFPPIPSEAILPLAGFFAERGELNVVLVVLVATLGSVTGALILYWVGYVGGRPLVIRHGRLLRLEPEHLDRAEVWFRRRGDLVVFVARMVPLLRSAVSVPAGTLRMPIGRFVVLTTAGTAIWNTALVGAGWLLGSEWERISEIVGTASRGVLVVVVLALVVVGIWWWRRRAATPSG